MLTNYNKILLNNNDRGKGEAEPPYIKSQMKNCFVCYTVLVINLFLFELKKIKNVKVIVKIKYANYNYRTGSVFLKYHNCFLNIKMLHV